MSDLVTHFNRGRIPAPRILSHSKHSCYAIMHFGLNTFTGKEWGYGDDDPAIFNPADFDADQIVTACRNGGLSGIIIVCKHHDGFCLWPTKTTPYNISRTPFRNGKGDIVREVSEACRAYGLDVGFYVSPWDRNHPAYGTPEYLKIYQEQLREIYSEYGPAFEAWFDGANGGDGYYGGACEKRRIDASTYYDWINTWEIVRNLQPDAAIFSDIGPDLRWPGNENGKADPDAYGAYTPHSRESGKAPAPGTTRYLEGYAGHSDGKFFIPPECDVPMRPGWFYHAEQDNELRSLASLVELYLNSVGNGGFLNLGIAPDLRGRLHDNDVRRLAEFKKAVDQLNGENVFKGEISLVTGESVTLEFGAELDFNLLDMSEDLSCGEKVFGYEIEIRRGGEWHPAIFGKAIGFRRIKPLANGKGDALKIRLTAAAPGTVKLTICGRQVSPELLIPEAGKIKRCDDYQKLGVGIVKGKSIEWDFKESCRIRGFIFTPFSDIPQGTPNHYRFEIRHAGVWENVSEGEFANLKANPIPQLVPIALKTADACRLTALDMLEAGDQLKYAEFGILVP